MMNGGDILFHAVYHDDLVTVRHATADEIEFLSGPVDDGQDILELRSLIAIGNGAAVQIHALGWRLLLANTCITPRVLVVNTTLGAVRTRSRKTYFLGVRDRPELDPELQSHLGHALKTWGFKDVRPGLRAPTRLAESNSEEEDL